MDHQNFIENFTEHKDTLSRIRKDIDGFKDLIHKTEQNMIETKSKIEKLKKESEIHKIETARISKSANAMANKLGAKEKLVKDSQTRLKVRLYFKNNNWTFYILENFI